MHNTSHGRPDFESVVNDFESVQDSNPGDVHGLGDQAVASHEWDEVTLLACRANLTVKVTYNSIAMVPPHRETPVPRLGSTPRLGRWFGRCWGPPATRHDSRRCGAPMNTSS